MKIVINVCYGGFTLPTEFCTMYELDKYDDIDRTDTRLVDFLESYFAATRKNSYSGRFSELVIKEIPDSSTDWHIDEYDGAESIIYVVDGKLHWA